MSRTKPTDTNIMDASRTIADLADTEPATAAAPKTGKRHRLKRMITGLALAAAALGAVAALPGGVKAASAYDPISAINYPLYSVYISSVSSGMLLDVQYGSQAPGALVVQWPNDYGANQLWDFLPLGATNPWGYIINVNSGQCISTDGILGDPVFQSPCQGAAWQRWEIVRDGGSSPYHIISYYNSNSSLDVYQGSDSPGAVIDLWPTGTNANQQFYLLPGPPA
jgi:Ricin-type beta-trefoil lectin domain-like